MSILYVKEHIGCENYGQSNGTSFNRYRFPKGETFKMDFPNRSSFVFVLSGEINVAKQDEEPVKFVGGNMYALGFDWVAHADVVEDCDMVLLMFDKPNIRCDEFKLMALRKYIPEDDIRSDVVRSLEMRPPIFTFIEGVNFYLSKVMFCSHLQDLKQSEWFFLMRAFYTKPENALFFSSLMTYANEFVLMVKANADKVETVKELADACNMTTKTFTRHFQKRFKMSPKQWMIDRKQSAVKLELLKGDVSTKEASNKLGFASSSHLASYTREKFNKTPQDMMKKKPVAK